MCVGTRQGPPEQKTTNHETHETHEKKREKGRKHGRSAETGTRLVLGRKRGLD